MNLIQVYQKINACFFFFSLQLLGFEVDAINSVQFCNHTGYKKVAGQILSEKDLDDLAGGLQQNGLDFYSHLLTGYIGAESFLRRVCSLVKHLKSVNPNLIYGITQTVRNFVQIKCFCCSL